MNGGFVTFLAGLGLLIPAYLGLSLSSAPTPLCPFPILTVGAAALSSPKLALLVPVLGFFLWNPGLWRGAEEIPKRTSRLLAVATALSALWFALGWAYGVEYQGRFYTHVAGWVNLIWLAALWTRMLLARKPSFGANLFLHWFLFAWLAWYAFPWLGARP